ncbi:Uncharacterised protein [Mycobacteroides abscessus subsp. abscessus]|nr:Uncharacterised protein [Mycobacteroides abscessus subsp. abscessus]
MGRSRATSSKNLETENFPVTLTCPPTSKGVRTLTQIALTWNNGRISRQ